MGVTRYPPSVMNNSDFGRRGVSYCAAAAMLAGCGDLRQSQGNVASSMLPAIMSQRSLGAAHPTELSRVAPDVAGKNLLYISDVGTDKVYIYSYPHGKLLGTLTGFHRPSAMCVDKEGDVFVPDLDAFKIYEYRHGAKKPDAVLHDPGEEPTDCAVDPITGNLAVANVSTPYTGPGDLLVYKHARGKPTKYRDPRITYYLYCGYDGRGNLYVDGMSGGAFKFAELPAGGSTSFTDISLDKDIHFGGAVQWDGHNVAVGDYESNVIYQFKIAGNTGTKVGETHLKGSNFAIGFWIQGSTVIGPNDESTNVEFWKYPGGGRHTKEISGLRNPWGAVVSLAK